MSKDSVSVTSSQSWFGRMGKAITGVLIGLVFFGLSFPLIFWNEGRAIRRAKTLEAGSRLVISVPASPVDPANEGRLVHLTGDSAAPGQLKDGVFGLSVAAIKLRRDVEMYQWAQDEKSETRKKLGGGEETVTTYSYQKKWSSSLIDSSEFQKPEGHQNPAEMPVPSKTFIARDVTVGDFKLPPSLVSMMDNYESHPVSGEVDLKLSQPVRLSGDGYYIGADSQNPVVGDARVQFWVVEPGPVSIIARQVGGTFEPFVMDTGSIELLQPGTYGAAAMFATERQNNTFLTWILRVAAFALMFIGLLFITRPISIAADVVPLFGNLAEAGLGLISFLVALPLTLATIAIAWLAYRPLISIPLLVLAAVAVFFAIRVLAKKKTPTPA